MKKQLVSVIIPTYNRELYIERAIQSVLNQTYENLECIVIDDGSDDHTKSIVEQIQKQDSRVKYYHHMDNSGPSKSRNKGIDCAIGEYIAFNDSDDVWRKNKLEKQMKYLNTHPQYQVVYCSYKLSSKNKTEIVPMKNSGDLLQGNILESLLHFNKVGTPTLLVKREVLDCVGNFDPQLKAIEDYELILRIAKQYEVGFVDEILVDAFSVGGVNSNYDNMADALVRIIDVHRDLEESKMQKFILNSLDMLENVSSIQHRTECIECICKSYGYDDITKKLMQKYVNKNRNNSIKMKMLGVIANKEKLKSICNENIKGYSIMIYGNGQIGRSCADRLKEIGIEIIGIIDREYVSYGTYEIFNIKQLPLQEFEIINTLAEDVLESVELEKQSGHRVISLQKICE